VNGASRISATSGSTRSQVLDSRGSAQLISRDRGTRETYMENKNIQNPNKVLQGLPQEVNDLRRIPLRNQVSPRTEFATATSPDAATISGNRRGAGSAQAPPSAAEPLPTGEGRVLGPARQSMRDRNTTPSVRRRIAGTRSPKSFRIRGSMPRSYVL